MMCYTIEEIKDKIIPIAKKHGISRMCLFGSYARGEANDDSDVEILKKIIGYCDDIELLKEKYNCSFESY